MDEVGESELHLDRRAFFLQMLDICGSGALLIVLNEGDPGNFDVMANILPKHHWFTLDVAHTLELEVLLNVFES